MSTPRQQFLNLVRSRAIVNTSLPEAAAAAGVHPNSAQWRYFLDRLVLLLGALALVMSLLFWVAYNWIELGRLGRFALVQTSLIAAVVVYLWPRRTAWVGTLALLSAALLLGVLLALYGQVYQTGADTWQLFFNWALLITPWVVVSRLPALLLLWIGLINLSAVLYHDVFASVWGGLLVGDASELWFIFMFTGAALALWEWLERHQPRTEWALRVLAVTVGVAMTLLMLEPVFGRTALNFKAVIWLVYPAALGLTYWLYRHWRFDLFMLAGGCLSVIVVLESLLLRAIIDVFDLGVMLLPAIALLAMGSAAALWLKRVSAQEAARHEQ